MIKVTYEYVCDICGKERHSPHQYCLRELPGFAIPQPLIGDFVGAFSVCDSCLMVAKEALTEILSAQSEA